MNRVFYFLAVLISLSAFSGAVHGRQDDPALELGLSRDLGYGSGAQIQGRFSYRVSAPDNVVRVEFLLDGEVIGEDAEPPFRLQFSTGDYELGWHELSAIGYTDTGAVLRSNALQRQFVPSQTGLYIVGAVVLLAVGFRVISHLLTRDRSSGKPGGYGMYGGAVCKHCGRPFSRHWWSPGLLVGRLERCPHCGKWSLTQPASPQMLASAEAFARELDQEADNEVDDVDEGEAERLKRQLEESRFDDV